MLKSLMEKQDQQDKRFIKMEKERAEMEQTARADKLAFAREHLQEQQLAREELEALYRRQDEMRQTLLLQMTRQGPSLHHPHTLHHMYMNPFPPRPFQVYLLSDIARWSADREASAVFGRKGRQNRIYR